MQEVKRFKLRNRSGTAIHHMGYQVTPQSQSFTLNLPAGGLVYNRPTSLAVVTPDGSQQRLPVVDITRWLVLGFGLLSLVFTILAILLPGRKGR